tara:strand:+ start:1620 stop:2558 length:939 start_codon:yes stop_codon:yes gene_type:complete
MITNNYSKVLQKAILSQTCPNIIIYGDKSVGKKYLLKLILPYESIKKVEYNDYTVIYTDKYYEFNIHHINRSNMENFFKTIHEIVRTTDLYGYSCIRRIIIKNFQKVKLTIQSRLRVIMEKYRSTAVFILISNHITSIIEPIRSRSLCIRIPAIHRREKREYVRSLIPMNENKSELYDNIYQLNNVRDIKIYCDCRDSIMHGYIDPILITCHKLYDILTKETLKTEDIQHIRDITYSIAKYNLSINSFYRELLGIFLGDPKYTIKQKTHLVKLFSSSEHLYIQSYRLLIHLEALFIQIHYLLALRDDEIYDK